MSRERARGVGTARRFRAAVGSLASLAPLVLAVGFGGSACGADGLGRVRAVTYPPDFHYITRDEIRTTMGGLAVEVVALDEILGREDAVRPEDREAVVAILTRMSRLAAQMKKGATSNHPRISRDTPRLREDVVRALDAARIVPPNYYYAGRVVESCTYCHVPRHESGPRID